MSEAPAARRTYYSGSFVARYMSRCPECSTLVVPGDQVRWRLGKFGKGRMYVAHLDCCPEGDGGGGVGA